MNLLTKLISLAKRTTKSKSFPRRWILASKRLEYSFSSKPANQENFYWYERSSKRLEKVLQNYYKKDKRLTLTYLNPEIINKI